MDVAGTNAKKQREGDGGKKRDYHSAYEQGSSRLLPLPFEWPTNTAFFPVSVCTLTIISCKVAALASTDASESSPTSRVST